MSESALLVDICIFVEAARLDLLVLLQTFGREGGLDGAGSLPERLRIKLEGLKGRGAKVIEKYSNDVKSSHLKGCPDSDHAFCVL